jgi:hypothetical protein
VIAARFGNSKALIDAFVTAQRKPLFTERVFEK